MFEELGQTPDEIAASLRTRGIDGVRNAVRFLNPIVRYASSLIPDVYGIDLILVDRLRIEFASKRVREVEVPAAVLEFLDGR